MRAIVVKKPGTLFTTPQSLTSREGDVSNLVLRKWEKPTPGKTELLVKVRCFALNRMDLMERKGTYPVPLANPIMGVEVSGIVELVGEQVTEFKPGDAVFGLLPKGGGYSEYAVMEKDLAMHKPEELSFEEAAAVPETWFVAYQALFLVGQLEKGDDVLVHAGASAVGIAAIQLAKEASAQNIYVTVGSDEKVGWCESIGAVHAINYKTNNWEKEIKDLTGGKGVGLIIDFVGKDYWEKNINSLAVDGRMVVLAYLSGCLVEQNISNFVIKRISIRGSNLRDRDLEYQANLKELVYNNVILKHLVKKEHIKIYIDRVFNWEEIAEAHTYLEKNLSKGKIVMKVTDNST